MVSRNVTEELLEVETQTESAPETNTNDNVVASKERSAPVSVSYIQKYRSEWESQLPWITKPPSV